MKPIFLFHVAAAVLATWRITELMTLDRISEKLRQKFKSYLWTCHRCISVWAGIYCSLCLFLFPWGNWPFALAWIYLTHNDHVFQKRLAKNGRQFACSVDSSGAMRIVRNELNMAELHSVLSALSPAPPVTNASNS